MFSHRPVSLSLETFALKPATVWTIKPNKSSVMAVLGCNGLRCRINIILSIYTKHQPGTWTLRFQNAWWMLFWPIRMQTQANHTILACSDVPASAPGHTHCSLCNWGQHLWWWRKYILSPATLWWCKAHFKITMSIYATFLSTDSTARL